MDHTVREVLMGRTLILFNQNQILHGTKKDPELTKSHQSLAITKQIPDPQIKTSKFLLKEETKLP